MPEIELAAVPGIVLLPVTFIMMAPERTSVVLTLDPLAHAQCFLLGVHGEVGGLIMMKWLVGLHFGFEASQSGVRNLLSRQLLSVGLGLHLLPEQRDVLDALELARVSQKSVIKVAC